MEINKRGSASVEIVFFAVLVATLAFMMLRTVMQVMKASHDLRRAQYQGEIKK